MRKCWKTSETSVHKSNSHPSNIHPKTTMYLWPWISIWVVLPYLSESRHVHVSGFPGVGNKVHVANIQKVLSSGVGYLSVRSPFGPDVVYACRRAHSGTTAM